MRKSWVKCPGCNRKLHAKTTKASTTGGIIALDIKLLDINSK